MRGTERCPLSCTSPCRRRPRGAPTSSPRPQCTPGPSHTWSCSYRRNRRRSRHRSLLRQSSLRLRSPQRCRPRRSNPREHRTTSHSRTAGTPDLRSPRLSRARSVARGHRGAVRLPRALSCGLAPLALGAGGGVPSRDVAAEAPLERRLRTTGYALVHAVRGVVVRGAGRSRFVHGGGITPR